MTTDEKLAAQELAISMIAQHLHNMDVSFDVYIQERLSAWGKTNLENTAISREDKIRTVEKLAEVDRLVGKK